MIHWLLLLLLWFCFIGNCLPAILDKICTVATFDNNVCGSDNYGPLFLVNSFSGSLTLTGI